MQQEIYFFAPRMSGQSSPNRDDSPEKEITEIKQLKTEQITAELDRFHLLIETLLNQVEEEEEQESDLDSIDGFVDTLGLIGKEIFELFQGEVDELHIPEDAKIALKTLSKFLSVLTNKKFIKVKKLKSSENRR